MILPRGRGGTRLFRWKESREHREARYSAWFYFPRAYRLTGRRCCRYFNLFQFKSRSASGANDPIWYIEIRARSPGTMSLQLVWWPRTLEGPHRGERGFRRFRTVATVPVRRWFRLTAFLRQSKDFDGRLLVWQNGKVVFDQRDVRTSYQNCAYNPWCAANEWSVNLYSDGLSPKPVVAYVDDARIAVP